MKKIIFLAAISTVIIVGGVVGYTKYIYITAAANTQYAAGYSVAEWQQVKPGMELTQVKQLLGEPLDIQTNPGEQYLYYGRQKNNTHYYIKAVVIGEDKIVRQIIDNLIVD